MFKAGGNDEAGAAALASAMSSVRVEAHLGCLANWQGSRSEVSWRVGCGMRNSECLREKELGPTSKLAGLLGERRGF